MLFLAVFAARAADYDCDGYDDLVMGVPYEDDETGYVHVMYGSSAGIQAADDQLWYQGTRAVEGTAEVDDYFGYAMGAGDFDANGCDDVAIGAYTDATSGSSSGAANILYGTTSGLSATGDQIWHQGTSGIEGTPEEYDFLGIVVQAGDFDGDGYDDVALSAAGEEVSGVDRAGAVNVLYGTSAGLSATDDQIFYQGTSGVQGAPETNDYFGLALAAADFDGDGTDDLAIGVPDEDRTYADDGVVQVLYGSASGLSGTADDYWSQASTGISGTPEASDEFGHALAACDFDADGYADLAIGVPYDTISGYRAGSVNVIYGSSTGLVASGQQLFSQNTSGVSDSAEEDDWFGWALACADFDGDGVDDLAVSAAGQSVGSATYAGAVHVLFGISSSGLSSAGSELWYEDVTGVGTSESDDFFGYALAAGDYDGDSYADLAVGAWGQDVSSVANGGAVTLLYGDSSGLVATGAQLWSQDTSGVQGSAEQGDNLGYSLR